MITAAILGLAGVSLGLSALALRRAPRLGWVFAPPPPVPAGPAQCETLLTYHSHLGQAHSPSILCRPDGFSVLWFEGSAEAQADVDIYEVSFAKGPQGWQASAAELRVGRQALGRAMVPRQLVVTLGNTIEDEARRGAVFSTVVSVGGWAAASVARVILGPGGPLRAEKLSLSPMLNRSALVKSPMLAYADGSHALPAYFEMGQMHGLLVRFHPDGRVADTRRMDGAGLNPIQPMIVPLDGRRAVAFLRDFDVKRGCLLRCETEDGGQSWSPVETTEIANPSAPVAALPLGDGRILMAGNDDPDAPADLCLSISADEGRTWQRCRRFEGKSGGLRYPMLRLLAEGEIALCYSHGTKAGICVQVMGRDWIEAGAGKNEGAP